MQANGHWFIDMFLWLQNLLGIGNKTAEEVKEEVMPKEEEPKEKYKVWYPVGIKNEQKNGTLRSGETILKDTTVNPEDTTSVKNSIIGTSSGWFNGTTKTITEQDIYVRKIK